MPTVKFVLYEIYTYEDLDYLWRSVNSDVNYSVPDDNYAIVSIIEFSNVIFFKVGPKNFIATKILR